MLDVPFGPCWHPGPAVCNPVVFPTHGNASMLAAQAYDLGDCILSGKTLAAVGTCPRELFAAHPRKACLPVLRVLGSHAGSLVGCMDPWSDMRHLPHSHAPNCVLNAIRMPDGSTSLSLDAIAPIAAGEVLTVDHSNTYAMCGCGACGIPACEGVDTADDPMSRPCAVPSTSDAHDRCDRHVHLGIRFARAPDFGVLGRVGMASSSSSGTARAVSFGIVPYDNRAVEDLAVGHDGCVYARVCMCVPRDMKWARKARSKLRGVVKIATASELAHAAELALPLVAAIAKRTQREDIERDAREAGFVAACLASKDIHGNDVASLLL